MAIACKTRYNLTVFFKYYPKFSKGGGGGEFSLYVTQITSGSCWNATFQKGEAWWEGKGEEEESKE